MWTMWTTVLQSLGLRACALGGVDNVDNGRAGAWRPYPLAWVKGVGLWTMWTCGQSILSRSTPFGGVRAAGAAHCHYCISIQYIYLPINL